MGGSIISDFIALIDFGKVFIFVYSSYHHKCVRLSGMINCTGAEEILHGNKVTLTQASAYIWNKKNSACFIWTTDVRSN